MRAKKRARASPGADADGDLANEAPAGPPSTDAPTTPLEILAPASPTQPTTTQPDGATSPPTSKKKLRPLPATPSFKPASLDTLRDKARRIQKQLAALYPSPAIPLHHNSSFQLLVAVILSAQSTDAKVNTVTPELFARGPDAAAMAAMEVTEIERIIWVLGLAPTKAKNVQRMSQILVERHGGQVPASFGALEELPGVGHKTASVVMSQAFGYPAFPVDTHIHRLAQRWGLSNGKSVEQTEQDLKTLLPEETWRDVHLQMIYFGREHCTAQRHDAAACPVCHWAAPGARGFPPGDSGAAGAAPQALVATVLPDLLDGEAEAEAGPQAGPAIETESELPAELPTRARRGMGGNSNIGSGTRGGASGAGPFDSFRAGRRSGGLAGRGTDTSTE